MPVVEPELVVVLEIIRDVEVGGTITIEVDELCTEPERLWLVSQLLAHGIAEAARRQRHAREVTAGIEVEIIWLADHRHVEATHVRAHHELEVLLAFGNDLIPVADLAHEAIL